MRPGQIQMLLGALLLVSFLIGMLLGIALVTKTNIKPDAVSHSAGGLEHNPLQHKDEPKQSDVNKPIKKIDPPQNKIADINTNKDLKPQDSKQSNKKMDQLEKDPLDNFPKPNYEVHAFYYIWYGNPKVDRQYFHWNHQFLPHWEPKEAAKWPSGNHEPPDDIGANFYPVLGPYSSRDPDVMDQHMKQMRQAGIGTMSVSWYPPDQADNEGYPSDDVIPALLDHADKYHMKVCFHIEPYKDRNTKNMRENIKYIVTTYGDHPAFYRLAHKGRQLPVFYLYDSYQVSSREWEMLFRADRAPTVRGTDIDGIFIGLLVEPKHQAQLREAGFDGFYTYFASDGFTFGSTTRHWDRLADEAKQTNMLFIPSVGPGYIDERIRPWNARNSKGREGGKYYERCFDAAVKTLPEIITITSFNEWHEGTQIEEAMPKDMPGYKYMDYSPHDSNYYLTLTRKWVRKFTNLKRGAS